MAGCHPADVTDISGPKYFPAVKAALTKAKNSINVAMYTIESSPDRDDAKPNQLITVLINAHKRGVEVEVILDQNVDFVNRAHASDWEPKVKSSLAYQRLKAAGVKVNYDDPARYTHAKCVIIDERFVILGSTNWTWAAFDNNIETDVLIDSPKLAAELLVYLNSIIKAAPADGSLVSAQPTTPIPRQFLQSPKLAALLVNVQAERAFDIYLYLVKLQNSSSAPKLSLSFDDLARHLGIYEGWTATDYRRQITKSLRQLALNYKLIKFEPSYAGDAVITLLDYADPAKVYNIPQAASFGLPDAYFDYGWNRQLSLRAKFCLLINLSYAALSDVLPYWSKSVSTISRENGLVSPDVIYKGMGELRRKKLLEVKYDTLTDKPFDSRRPKMYKLLKLYDPKAHESKLAALKTKYGPKVYDRARDHASLVFEENNPEVIEDIILKTKQFGEPRVAAAFRLIALKNIDNPLRTYTYVAGIIEKE